VCLSDTVLSTGAACVLFGGVVAGVASEVVSTLTLPLEEQGIAAYVKQWTLLPNGLRLGVRLNSAYFHSIRPSVFSTVLGFVAYEYAKDIHFINASDDPDDDY
jgi:hypothetical protein